MNFEQTGDRVIESTMGKGEFMFLIGVVFLSVWATGLATSHTMGGFIHVLLVLAIIALMSHMIRGGNSSKVSELRAPAPQPGTWGSEK